MTDFPNLYSFTTKERFQDAALAYILAWADPKYRNAPEPNSGMHALGQALLGALVASHPAREDWAPEKVTSIQVATQEKRVDVRAEITTEDGKIFLIVEDKIHTSEHGSQIREYVEQAKSRYEESEIVPVYLKTGNESPNRKMSIECGRIYRRDLLAVLDDHRETGNRIVDDFRDHWHKFDAYTQSFRHKSPSTWDRRQCEGYYLELEKRLSHLGLHAWWHPDTIRRARKTYLHLFCHPIARRDGIQTRIQIRFEPQGLYQPTQLTVQAMRRDGDVDVATLHRLLREHQAGVAHLSGARIHKSGRRFVAGPHPPFMRIIFGDDSSYVALDPTGKVDLNETANRIVRVREFLTTVSDGAIDTD